VPATVVTEVSETAVTDVRRNTNNYTVTYVSTAAVTDILATAVQAY
jgi:hypothetical protein